MPARSRASRWGIPVCYGSEGRYRQRQLVRTKGACSTTSLLQKVAQQRGLKSVGLQVHCAVWPAASRKHHLTHMRNIGSLDAGEGSVEMGMNAPGESRAGFVSQVMASLHHCLRLVNLQSIWSGLR